MGGLMEESASHDQNGVPEVSDLPLLGALFKGKDDDRSVNELVIFLRATIIDPHDQNTPLYQDTGVGSADAQVYENFTQDPRPWEMPVQGPIEVS